LKVVREPRMEFPERLGRQVRDVHGVALSRQNSAPDSYFQMITDENRHLSTIDPRGNPFKEETNARKEKGNAKRYDR
jgi:hypothetical protein